MSIQIQFRRGTTAEHSTFTGAVGEITVDTTKDTAVVHDNSQVGGFALLREDGSNSALSNGSASAPSLKFSSSTTTGIYSPGTNQFAIATNGSERMRIDSSGNVKIGGTSAIDTDGLSIETTGASGGLNIISPTNGRGDIFFGDADDKNIGQIRYSHVNNSLTIRTNASDRFVIDSSGRLLVGTSSSYGIADQVQIVSDTGVNLHRGSANTAAPRLDLSKSRNTTYGSNTIVQSGDTLGSIVFRGDDGTDYTTPGGEIKVEVDGTPGANDMPGRLVFSTTADGASTPTERMRIDSSGNMGVGTTSPGSYNSSANDLVISGSDSTGITISATSSTSSKIHFADGTTSSESYRGIIEYDHAVDGMLFATAANERARIDSSGRLLVGTSSDSTTSTVTIQGNSASSSGGAIFRMRIGTGTPADNNTTGVIKFEDNTGGTGAEIEARRDGGTWSASSKPSRLVFSTTADGASSPTERMRIDSSGRLGVGTTSPNAPLEVVGSSDGDQLRINQNGQYYRIGREGAGGLLQFYGAQSGYNGYIFDGVNGERARIDSSGRLLVGTSTARKQANIYIPVQTETTGSSPYAGFGAISNANNTVGSYLILSKSRGTSLGSSTIVQSGDVLGDIWFTGADGTDLATGAARIKAEVDGTPGVNDMPGRLVFSTTADGASTPTERMRIDSSGRLGVGTGSPTTNVEINAALDTGASLGLDEGQLSVGREANSGGAIRIGYDTTNNFGFISSGRQGVSWDNLILNAGGGKMGVGTTSPGERLSILEGNAIGWNDTSGNNSARIYATSGDELRFDRGSTNSRSMTIDSSGRLLVGTSSARSNLDISTTTATPQFQLEGTSFSNSAISIIRNSTATGAASARLFLGKSNGASVGSNVIVADDDLLGQIVFNGNDGTEFIEAASIGAEVDGTPGSNDMPGRLVFSTTADGASTPTERMRIDSSGRLGVGTTNPLVNFDVVGSTNRYLFDLDATVAEIKTTNAAGNVYADTRYNAASHRFDISNSEKARIDNSGRLLVGTSSTVSVAGSSAFIQQHGNKSAVNIAVVGYNNNFGGPILAFGSSRSTTVGTPGTIVASGDILGDIRFAGDDGTDMNTTSASIRGEVDGAPGANDMPGRLVFSTCADGSSSLTERMRITNDGQLRTLAAETAFMVSSATSAGTSEYLIGGHYSASSPGTGTNSFRVYTNGNVQNTNNSYGAISDAKLKENIVDASSQWDDIKDLRVRNYNFIEGQTHTQIGVVAQEVETVSPGLVTESPDRDAEGNDLGTVTKSVNYSVLYMKAVKALQEAMERIETLEAKVAALEAS